jgi:hypothetical protein
LIREAAMACKAAIVAESELELPPNGNISAKNVTNVSNNNFIF